MLCSLEHGADGDMSLSIFSLTPVSLRYVFTYALSFARRIGLLHTGHGCVAGLWLENEDDELRVGSFLRALTPELSLRVSQLKNAAGILCVLLGHV